MPQVPTASLPNANYPITISDGTNTIGITNASKTGLRRLPRGAGVERKALGQANWTGGRGNQRLSTDTSRFWDAKNLWSMVQGNAINGPQFRYAQQMGTASIDIA